MSSILKEILDYKILECESQRRKTSLKDLQKLCEDTEPSREFLGGFHPDEINVVAETKRKSPSGGVFFEDYKPQDVAQMYQDAGAKALSVLTDERYFGGCLEDLKKVRSFVKLPILRKDFTTHEYHIWQARAHEADAVLLIAAALDPYQMKDYHDLAIELGLTPLVEIHSEEEWNHLSFQPKLLGINNRNLKTLKTDVKTSEELLPKVGRDIPVIAESGLKDHETLVKLKEKGAAGFLIGESLLKSDHPGKKLRNLLTNM
jgi:indole-3-glycerol phosphate synthase